MHESRLHKGKPEDIPETVQGNSFRRAVRSVEGAMQGIREGHKENRSLICSRSFKTKSRRGNLGAIFFATASTTK
jgi:hypothetical protein